MNGDMIWVMESECCEWCNSLLGYFGECTNPGCVTWEGWTPDYDERAYLMGEYDEGKEKAGTSDL